MFSDTTSKDGDSIYYIKSFLGNPLPDNFVSSNFICPDNTVWDSCSFINVIGKLILWLNVFS